MRPGRLRGSEKAYYMELRQVALEVARILQDAGKHALNDQMNPRDLKSFEMSDGHLCFTSDTDKRLSQFISNRITYVDVFDGFWQFRPDECHPGERYWCVGGIDGAINFIRNMPEWAITVTLFEFNDQCSAQPILSVVHAPALGLTYLAVRGSGAIRIRKTPLGDKREKIMPSTTKSLDYAVVSFGMSHVPEESKRALDVVARIAGRPADIKRVGPVALDLCKVADGTYDASAQVGRSRGFCWRSRGLGGARTSEPMERRWHPLEAGE